MFERIVESEGFQLKAEKTKTEFAEERQTVTNFVVNRKVNLTREKRAAIKKEVKIARSQGGDLAVDRWKNVLVADRESCRGRAVDQSCSLSLIMGALFKGPADADRSSPGISAAEGCGSEVWSDGKTVVGQATRFAIYLHFAGEFPSWDWRAV